MTRFHDVPFVVEPFDDLSDAERRVLAGLTKNQTSIPVGQPFRLKVERGGSELAIDAPPESRADIGWTRERITVRHETFAAEIWPLEKRGTLRRSGDGPFPLQLTIETAACSTLPASSMVVLHAACVIVDGRACIFFGPSGIGKSTLADLAPHPVMAEELVAVGSFGQVLAFSCEGLSDREPRHGFQGSAPVAAIFELGRADGVEISRLDSAAATKSLLGSTLVYPIPALWNDALGVIRDVISFVPVYRFGWSLQTEAWNAIARIARGES